MMTPQKSCVAFWLTSRSWQPKTWRNFLISDKALQYLRLFKNSCFLALQSEETALVSASFLDLQVAFSACRGPNK